MEEQKLSYEVVENLRKVMGTLPEERPPVVTDFHDMLSEVRGHTRGPYDKSV